VAYIFLGGEPPESIVGDKVSLEAKAALVRARVITPEFRAEFFFKHAIKVPYLTDIDWEVVFKLFEKNVVDMPGVSYALLSLRVLDPSSVFRVQRESRILILDELIDSLVQAKGCLTRAKAVTKAIDKELRSRGKEHAIS
jgi:hypothetical protein